MAESPAPSELDWITEPALLRVLEDPPFGAIPVASARYIFETALAARPEASLEIGIGFASSALSILQAYRQNGISGRHVCVEQWHLAPGLARLADSGLADLLDIRIAPSHLALPKLVEEGLRVDFAMIDGRHLFDFLLVDLFYTDLLLRPGGIVICDDATWPGLAKALSFWERNRQYQRLDAAPGRLAAFRKRASDSRVRLKNSREPMGEAFTDF